MKTTYIVNISIYAICKRAMCEKGCLNVKKKSLKIFNNYMMLYHYSYQSNKVLELHVDFKTKFSVQKQIFKQNKRFCTEY